MSLKELQKYLKDKNIPAFFQPMSNMFLGQDILPEENKIKELTGFSGSAGMLLVTPEKAWLLVDGRYAIQARYETNPKEVTVVDSRNFFLTLGSLCRENQIQKLFYNPWCVSVKNVRYFCKVFSDIVLQEDKDLTNPLLSSKPVEVFAHDIKYAGKSVAEKCAEVAAKIPSDCAALLITSADQVSWLMNLRSHTLPDTPVLRAYALLDRSGKACVYADACVYEGIKPLSALAADLQTYCGRSVLADVADTPQQILNLLPESVDLCFRDFNPAAKMKLIKNETELAGYKNAHLRDGVAVSKFLCWLENHRQGMTEWDVVQKLGTFRRQQDLFFSESFGTIAAVGANAAVVHYQPSEKNCAMLEDNTVLLLDSGAQYYDGTTDVTRTIALGTPSTEIKTAFTYVLKAHIALATARFPEATSGNALDAIARVPLWRQGMDYAHGTGHGVGHFANVHEGPFAISAVNPLPIYCNYVTSNEPGYYKEGAFGIRIENMVYTVPAEYDGYLKFENLTLIPIDKRLIDKYLLSSEEQSWLNSYHQKVFNCLAPYMNANEQKWLEASCSPL